VRVSRFYLQHVAHLGRPRGVVAVADPHAENGEDKVTEEEWALRRRLVSDISHPNKRNSGN
jgi:hypothetical protein